MKKQLMRCGIGTVLVLVMVFSLWGCVGPQEVPEEPDKSEPPVQEDSSAFAEMLKTLDGSRFTYMEGAGNISAEYFVSTLKNAAAGGYTLEENVENGYDPTAGYCWSLEAYFEGDLETTGLSWNDLHIRAECYFTENLAKVWYGKAGAYDVATFNDESLYQLILHKDDREHRIDEDDYEKLKDILTEQMELNYNRWKDSPGNITGYELLEFYHVGSYEEDGTVVELYDFDYALIPENPEKIMLVGGIGFDSQFRLINFNGGGQLAVRYRDGEMTAHNFMEDDFHYIPCKEENAEVDEAQREYLKNALDAAEHQE